MTEDTVEVQEWYYHKGSSGLIDGREGNVITEFETKTSCAKKRWNSRTNTYTYFIKRGLDGFIDPYNTLAFAKRYKLTKVTAELFDMYIRFLATGRKVFKQKAERLI